MGILRWMALSFLPKKYRQIFTVYDVPTEAALLSGIVEMLASVGLLVRGFYAYSNARLASIPLEIMMKAGEREGERAIMGLGNIVFLEYVFHVTTMVLLWFAMEGGVRAVAAILGEVLPSFPLSVMAFVHTRLSARGHEWRMGKRVRDVVRPLPDGQQLLIASCRPKTWNQSTTISHEDELYELSGEERAQGPRPFVYILRKKPVTGIIRGIHIYDPEEVLVN
jgi:hypothetical protein